MKPEIEFIDLKKDEIRRKRIYRNPFKDFYFGFLNGSFFMLFIYCLSIKQYAWGTMFLIFFLLGIPFFRIEGKKKNG